MENIWIDRDIIAFIAIELKSNQPFEKVGCIKNPDGDPHNLKLKNLMTKFVLHFKTANPHLFVGNYCGKRNFTDSR